MSSSNYGGLQPWLDRQFKRLAGWAVQHTTIMLLALVALTVLAGVQLMKVTQDTSLDSYFDPDDPAFLHYKAYQKEFNSDEVIYLVYKAPDAKSGVFDVALMRTIDRLTQTIEAEVPFVRKATSLTNVETIEASGPDDLVIRRLRDKSDFGANETDQLRTFVMARPMYVGTLVSQDAQHGAIVVEMTLNSTDPINKLRHDPKGGDGLDNVYPQVSNNKLTEILARPEFKNLETMRTGDVPWNATYNYVLETDTGTITLATLGMAALLCMLLFRARLLGLVAPLMVVVLGIVMTMAVIGTLGYQINMMFLMLPTLICAIGIAQSVHMLTTWQNEYRDSGSASTAARLTLEKVGTPALLCALTTAAGLIGMTTSQLKSMREFGLYSAAGVLLTLVVTLLVLTGISARAKPRPQQQKLAARGHPRWLEGIVFGCLETALAHPKKVLAGAIGATALAVAGISMLRVDFNFAEELKPSVQWRADNDQIERIMGGLLSVVYVFDTGRTDGIQDPAVLNAMASLQAFAQSQPEVADATSIVDYLRELNQAFHGGDPAYRVLPENREALAQLMLVYELSGGTEMNDVRNIDRSKAVLELRIKSVSASKMRALMDKLDAHIAAHPLPGTRVELSGIGLLWVKIASYIANSQISGAASSFFLILVFISVAFGSLRLGLWAMIPNVLPIVFVLGFMGAAGWTLDYFRMMLASVTMGIAVDDTIHILARLRTAFAQRGNYREALRETMHEVGIPLTMTSFALMAAFSSYLLSDTVVLSSFGALLCGCVLVGWLVELLVTPTLMVLFKPFGPELPPVPVTTQPNTDARTA